MLFENRSKDLWMILGAFGVLTSSLRWPLSIKSQSNTLIWTLSFVHSQPPQARPCKRSHRAQLAFAHRGFSRERYRSSFRLLFPIQRSAFSREMPAEVWQKSHRRSTARSFTGEVSQEKYQLDAADILQTLQASSSAAHKTQQRRRWRKVPLRWSDQPGSKAPLASRLLVYWALIKGNRENWGRCKMSKRHRTACVF